MPGPTEASAQDFVLRALAASEIAESCTEPRIRESFFALAEGWLKEAGRVEDGGGSSSAAEELRL
jgi:hypothetical protein